MAPLDRSTVAQIVRAGLLAPSGDNCQPWRFVWNGRGLDLILVYERAESLYDVQHTASWIALGATITNMRLMAQARGYDVSAQLFPRGHGEPHAARISFEPMTPHHDPLTSVLEARCANRRPYQRTPLTAALRDELLATARSGPGTSLELIEIDQAKRTVAALAARNDQILFENRALHDGLYRWLRWTTQESGDGMPIGSLELHPVERPGFHLLGSWPVAHTLAACGVTRLLPLRTQRTYQRSAALGLLTAEGQRPEDFVHAGEVLERLWLTSTLQGLAFQPITGMICLLLRCRLAEGQGLSPRHRALVEATGAQLATVFPALAHRTPIMLFRIGFAAPPTARTLRRPVEDVLSLES